MSNAASAGFSSRGRYFYLVRHGDTLSGIARTHYNLRHGSERHAAAIAHVCRINGLSNPNLLRAGRPLLVTPLPPAVAPAAPVKLVEPVQSMPAPPAFTLGWPTLPGTTAEQDMFRASSWYQENSDWLTTPASMLTDATGRLLHEKNLALLRNVKTFHDDLRAGRITRGQYDYRRRMALKQFSQRVGPLERVLFGGSSASEAVRIARGGGIPATQNVTRHAARLTTISRAVNFGAPVVLTAASMMSGCLQIGATQDRVEKNEIFVETAMSTLVGLSLGFVLASNPVGWCVALVLVAGSAAASYGAGKGASATYRLIYDKFGNRYNLDAVSFLKVDRLC